MSRSKIALITAAILTTIGIVGSVITGITVVPKTISAISDDIKNSSYVEIELNNYAEDIENLNIDVDTWEDVKIEIRKSADANTRVKTYEINKNYFEVENNYKAEDKSLNVNMKKNKSFHTLENIETQVKRMYPSIIGLGLDKNLLIIEVPKGVNIDINSKLGVSVEAESNDVLKDDFKVESNQSHGSVHYDLPKNNTLKNFEIVTDSTVALEVMDFINAENVDIQADYININSKNVPDNYDLSKIPNKVSLRAESVYVNSYVPLGKDVNIYAKNNVEYESDFNDYNFVGKIENKNGRYNEDRDYNNDNYDYRDNDIMKFENMSVRLNNGIYSGKLSNAEGTEYVLNITTLYTGKITNDTKSNIKNHILMNGRK